MKHKLLNKLLTLALLTLGGVINPAWADDYERITSTGDLVAGEKYIFVCEGKDKAMGSVGSYGVAQPATITSNTITATSNHNILTLGGSSGAWTFYTDKESKYLTWSSGNSLGVSSTANSDSEKWTISFSDNNALIANKGTSSRKLRYNASSPRFACYTSDQTHIQIYKKKSIVATALSVGTAPTKLNYKVGETLDLTGLVLNATVGGTPTDVTSGYDASPANGATLDEVGAQTVTLTYGGQSTTQTIHVGDLESIALTTTSVKTTYDEGQSFDPTNLVVTATYSDGETTATTWTEDVDLEDCKFDPDGTLETTDDNVEVSYTWGSTEKTANIAITVKAASAYTVTFNAGTGSCGTSSLTEASPKAGVTLPTATIGVTGWSFVGWATASQTNTEEEPTTYASGATYNPTENCTLYAVYKFSETSATTYKRATSVSDITGASSVVIVCNNQSKVLDNTLASGVTAPTESSSKITAPEKAIFTLTGNNTDGYTLTNSTTTVGATSTNNSTQISNTTTNSLWIVKAHSTSNTFYFENKGKSNLCLEYYNNSGYKWLVYAPSSNVSSNAAIAMKVYVPVTTTVYNSNPAAMVDPTIAWTTDGDKTLYLQNTSTYTNAASVTGIAKSPVYTSSDETVATVTSTGEVTAVKKGTATIKATVDAEMGVNTKAEVSYVVTVKDASNVAGLKEVATSSTATSFTADLTDAVVTYVNGSYAYIEDASGAIYASCGSSLTAGKKINGAVSGSVKVSYKIDEITAIDLSGATVEDGVIPSAIVQTTAQVVANKATLEGKLVSVTGAKVTASLTSGNASGGKIKTGTDDEINLYAPASNIDALKDAEGTFNGYISLYNDGLRFNIYEQSQITLTKNAPTAQTLTFTSDAVELDEDTDDVEDFAGQTVSGAQGSVTYSKVSDASSIVTSVNASTGAVVLSGNCGTATIKATASAANVTEAGVTTPYTETEKTYTITVYPRYTVTFSANGVETPLRQASHGASVAVPSPSDVSGFKFMGWSTSTVALTDDEPSMESLSSTVTPENNTTTYYAVYASATVTPDVKHTSTFTIKQSSAPSNPYVNNGSSWTWSDVTFLDGNNACINKTSGSITFTLPASGKAVSLNITKTGNSWAGAAAVVLKDASNNTVNTYTSSSLSFDFTEGTYDESSSYTLTNTTGSNAWVDYITFVYTADGISYKNYCTTVPAHVNIAGTAGYTTYVATDNVSFPSGTNAYIATKVNTSTIHLEEVAAVPDGTAVIVKGDKGVYLLDVEDESDCDDVSENLLLASDGYVTGGTGIYALAKKGEPAVVGFYPVSSDVTIPAGKAYLDLGDSDVKAFTFEFEDDADGIKTLSNSPLKGENIYNLAGQRISKMQKGINIVNGKKILK